MDRQILNFTVNEQILVCENPIKISTNKVNYIQAHFDLGTNWSGFDSVRAVWFNDFNCISTVLDSLGNCVVPFEVMKRKGNVKVNLVGSISEDDVLTDRLTSYPVVAVIVDCTAQITGANTSPITPSEYEQFVAAVHEDVERAEQGASNAETSAQNASDSATSAHNSAQSAHDDKIAIEEAIAEVIQQIEDFEQVQVVVNTLPPLSQATSDFTDGVLTLGIPQGVKGDTGNGIQSIRKTGTSGLVDTYTITFTDGQTTTFTVTNGAKGDTGNGISTIEKTSTVGLVDTYTITYTDGTTTTFTVTNGEKGDKGDTGEAGGGAVGTVASAYSASKTYAVGDYVIHNSNLYRCTTAITTVEAFTAAHWTQVVLGDDVSDLKSDIAKSTNAYNIPYIDNTVFIVTDGSYTGNTGYKSFRMDVIAGGTVKYKTSHNETTGHYGIAFFDESGSFISGAEATNTLQTITVPNNASYCWAAVRKSASPSDIEFGFIAPFSSLVIEDKKQSDKKTIEKVPVLNLVSSVSEKRLIVNNGLVTQNNSYDTCNYIKVSQGDKITFTPKVRIVAQYYSPDIMIPETFDNTETYTAKTVTAVADGYMRATFYSADEGSYMAVNGETAYPYSAYSEKMEENIKLSDTQKNDIESMGVIKSVPSLENLVNPTKMVSGFLYNNGEIAENASYITTDYIPIESGQSITFGPKIRMVGQYDTTKQWISASYDNIETYAVKTYTASADGYVRATFYVADSYYMAMYGSTLPPYFKQYCKVVENNIHLSNDMQNDILNGIIGNPLHGKKWYACGDSFTHGAFDSDDGNIFEDGLYVGRYKVYPFFIGNRTGMEVINLAVNGMTMGKSSSSYFSNSSNYTKIGSDADYITLKFGINDGNYSVPIGTISDNDNTTYYGAWNVVLTWLITNRPTAKIGIIVSNGLSGNAIATADEYAEATINIAKKYGIPYLNEWSGFEVPVLIRNGRTDLSNAIKTIRDETFRVSVSNTHPNAICHAYESTFVENWLKTL